MGGVRIGSATAQLAAFASGLRYEDLPEPVIAQAKRFLLDALGCAVGAWGEDPRKAELARRIVEDFAASGRATLIGGGRSHPAVAALGNGILINATDNDDTHKRALAHVGSVVVPAALAVTEDAGGGGRDLIVAMVAGYEVTARVGMAVMPTHYRFWHSTATNGTFGAAAAAGRAMGLDADRMLTAFGAAGTQAAGLNTFFESGDDTKSLHPGKAGLNGVLSAKAAAFGLTSPPDIFGHPKGYLAAYSLEPRPEMLTRGLGSEWMILDNGFKFFPSILASHSPIGAALRIAENHAPDPAAIASVTVRTYATVKSHFSSKAVDTTMAARLSVPYCVAIALVDRVVGQAQFGSDRYGDPIARGVMEKVEIVADEDLTRLYPEKFPAEVTVRMADGREFREAMFYPKGDPSNPLSDVELATKFRTNVEPVLGKGRADAVEGLIAGLQDLDDVGRLTAHLGAR
ncbi:MmgE/PrpD family protein [Enterovirga rhinocerotis]|uniref:2-methylcitrate dehydratase PrpD n=1 Tax=Enterovirga rhinocerotis TaxID=1339210 RepID=A0A4V3DYM2_9HYPH|nr:MmgE/PrpD family protein [Enterovirga rhinocerotis]TDR93189.1 2-methylcitrate dehydratase PrpD [Enterovirga rhinocerotis]